MKKLNILVPVVALLFGCTNSFYLQNATVTHLSPSFIPHFTQEYKPKTLGISLAGNLSPSEPYRFNNGEHTKVNSQGEFEIDSAAGYQFDRDNAYAYTGKNVAWNMGMAKADLLLIYDFSKFFCVSSQMSFGGNAGNYYYDLAAEGGFRVAGKNAGFRIEGGLGFKNYEYSANVIQINSDSYHITGLNFSGHKVSNYLQIAGTFNANFQLPVGFFIQGSYRYAANLITLADSNDLGMGNSAHLNPSSVVVGLGLYGILWQFYPYMGINLLMATDANKYYNPYPIYSFGVRRDISFANSQKP